MSDKEIEQRLDAMVAKMVQKYPHLRHFRILASVQGVDIREVGAGFSTGIYRDGNS